MSAILDIRGVKRVSLRAVSGGLVRNLRGFAKGHEVPARANQAARKFVARLAAEEIKADLDQTFQAVRDAFGFKRRELEASSDGGTGYLRTPYFEYRVQVELDSSDPKTIYWYREIVALRDFTLIGRPEFRSAFGSTFDVLVLEFRKPIDVLRLIDRIEGDARAGVRVICPSDAAWCEIVLNGFRGAIRVDSDRVRIEGRRRPPQPSLFDQFLAFIQRSA